VLVRQLRAGDAEQEDERDLAPASMTRRAPSTISAAVTPFSMRFSTSSWPVSGPM
jgi:hypothetical protein